MSVDRREWLSRKPQPELSKKLGIAAWILSAVVLLLVGLMRRPEMHITLPDGVSFNFLPPAHAALNALAAVMLIGALWAVKAGRIALHQKFIMTAMGLSVVFLLCYVAYHFTSTEVLYGDVNFDRVLDASEREAVSGSRPLYLILLLTHIAFAAVSLPFILFTFIAGFTNRFEAHRRLARWVFPIWLYVAITGPVCYWLLRPYYGH